MSRSRVPITEYLCLLKRPLLLWPLMLRPTMATLPGDDVGAPVLPLGRWGYAARYVGLEHVAEPLPTSDRTSSDRRSLGRAERVAQTLVGPLLMNPRCDSLNEEPVEAVGAVDAKTARPPLPWKTTEQFSTSFHRRPLRHLLKRTFPSN